MASNRSPVPDTKYAKWAIDYKNYIDSGLTQKQWCSENGISVNTFRYRISHLKSVPATANVLQQMELEDGGIEVTGSVNIQESESIILELDNKRIIIGSNVPFIVMKLILDEFLKSKEL